MKKTSKIKPLELTKITSYRVDYHAFENFVKEVYRKDFNFVEDQESSNDSSHEFWVSKKKMNKYDQEKLEEFTNDGEYFFTTSMIMNDLCQQGMLKAGHYIVRVCW